MEIQVLFFGITADLVGKNSIILLVEKKTTIKQLKYDLTKEYSSLKNINDFAIAVNEDYAEDNLMLKKGDIVAIIPPVSGG
ncbi:MoaD/ThiS family protein [Lutibacter sp. B1]|uniref:MoaD/ThiS family protein n=1 Tax=Lutibacter sp. B1 TaxID=2725996 RepID=UPI0014576B18|nr:MoaD/ThiS family protein [Lutibacter sp. B1]NLP57839.1 MoaD/ThiS family protein [Lutibacter sp. B1]